MKIQKNLLAVANEILGLRYVEMTELAGLLINAVKSQADEGKSFDPTSETEWCELIRWWAEGYIDAAENEKAA